MFGDVVSLDLSNREGNDKGRNKMTALNSQRCVALMLNTGSHSRRCTFHGSLEHEGERYCKRHHPPTIKSKEDERYRGWLVKKKDQDAAKDKTDAVRKAEQRVLKAANDLREDWIDSNPPSIVNVYEAVRALKALGWEPEL